MQPYFNPQFQVFTWYSVYLFEVFFCTGRQLVLRGHFLKTHSLLANTFIFAGQASDLYEFIVIDDLSVVQGCGLGGGSLINANVALDAEPEVFQDPSWPK